ncbi:Metallo-hydrolase/oxidoreductase [Schizophyllum commune H4-8]|nr:Metallo-hydrolase/oxidoreductase [Schizophyllum commune H4-8]KAI5893383.1 Metallo-hydrolase/oxidoreductase [Schizophyllum commune H4-8]
MAPTDPIVVTFLGTVSAVPSLTRSNSSLALRLNEDVWLFDCGEATLRQLQRSRVKMGSIRKIFITHLHADHICGLIPLLCTILDSIGGTAGDSGAAGSTANSNAHPLEIYGPRGLRAYIRSGLTYTHSFIQKPYVVHELRCPSDPDFQSALPLQPQEHEGRDIAQGEENVWRDVFTGKRLSVSAAPLLHTCPCVGYVVHEAPMPGRMNPKLYESHIKRNGITKKVGHLYGRLSRGEAITLPDGTVLHGPPPRPGRKIVILGDTHDPSAIAPLAMDADLLVHEATLAHLPGVDPSTKRADTYESVEERAKSRGHSTPQMAGAFAKRIGAKRLVLNHFSRRYSGGRDARARNIMEAIGRLAEGEFGKPVECARDLDEFVVKLAN